MSPNQYSGFAALLVTRPARSMSWSPLSPPKTHTEPFGPAMTSLRTLRAREEVLRPAARVEPRHAGEVVDRPDCAIGRHHHRARIGVLRQREDRVPRGLRPERRQREP